MQTMSFEWVAKGGHIEGISAFMNPYLYLIDRNHKSKWDGWETRIIEYCRNEVLPVIGIKRFDDNTLFDIVI